MKTSLKFLSLCLVAAGCSRSNKPLAVQELPAFQATPDNNPAELTPPPVTLPSAADFYLSLQGQSAEADFQIAESVKLQPNLLQEAIEKVMADPNGTAPIAIVGDRLEIAGRHNPAMLPQLRYATASECQGGDCAALPLGLRPFHGALKQAVAQVTQMSSVLSAACQAKRLREDLCLGLSTKLDFLTQADQLFTEATQGLEPGQLPAPEVQEQLLQVRAMLLPELVEAQVPGAFSADKEAALGESPLLKAFLTSLGNDAVIANMETLREILTARTSLLAGNWKQRADRLHVALLILSKPLSTADATVRERVARFALSQWLTAQILTVKGIEGALQLRDNGRLPTSDLLRGWENGIARTQVSRVYRQALTPARIAELLEVDASQIEVTLPRLDERSSPLAEVVQHLRYLTLIAGSRNQVELWGITPERRAQRPALSAALLKLGFGALAVQSRSFEIVLAKQLQPLIKAGLSADAAQVTLLRQSSDSELAALGDMSTDYVIGFASLRDDNAQDQFLFNVLLLADIPSDQREAARQALRSKLLGGFEKFAKVAGGIGLIGSARLRAQARANQEINPELLKAIRKIGFVIRNKNLATFDPKN